MNPLKPTSVVRPVAAGAPIWCPAPGANIVGTLGLVVEKAGLGWFGLTCRHVLVPAGTTPSELEGVPIYQPAVDDPGNVIGFVDPAYVSDTLDAAAFRFLPDVAPTNDVDQRGPMGALDAANANQQVMKLGYVTGSTEGNVVGGVAPPSVLIEPVDLAKFARIGDSGAVWFSPDSLSPVALHTGVRFTPSVRSASLDIIAALVACGLQSS
jgi:hypothetical protein